MKKLSLLLALMLILTCGVFAACGEDADTSSTASTNSTASTPADASDASSEADDVSSEAATSSDASVDASTDASSDASDDELADIEGVVISGGASYTMQDLFRQNANWEWDATCDPAYPDTDNVEMTDGVFAPAEAHQLYDAAGSAWAGFHSMHPDYESLGYSWITVDLGEAKEITGAKIYSASSTVSAATIANVTVRVSEDGENWTDLGSTAVVDDASLTVIETAIAGTATAQYVQFQFTASGYWIGICEVEVYGAE